MAVFAFDLWLDRLIAWRASPTKACGSAIALVAVDRPADDERTDYRGRHCPTGRNCDGLTQPRNPSPSGFVASPGMFRSLNLMGQAEATRDLARRARRLAASMVDDSDKSRLLRHAEDLERQAARMERDAVPANRVIARLPSAEMSSD